MGIAIGLSGASPVISMLSLIEVSRFVAFKIILFCEKSKREQPKIGSVDLEGTTLIVFCSASNSFFCFYLKTHFTLF